MKALVLLSGGVDSTTALYWAKQQGYELHILSINYCDRPPKEIAAVKQFAKETEATLIEIRAEFIQEASEFQNIQISVDYFKKAPDGYIPSKNLIFYSIALYYAEIYQVDVIIGGHSKLDAQLFPDASKEFFKSLTQLANSIRLPHNPCSFDIVMPLIDYSKEEIINLAIELGTHLEWTWSCYDTKELPCGDCKGCTERSRAFEKLGLEDPLNSILHSKMV